MTDPIIYAMLQQESGGNPTAVSPKGAQGLMQIMPDTARNPGYGVTPLQGWDGANPMTAPQEEQIRFGNDYYNALLKHFNGDQKLALAAYNAGAGKVEQYGGVPPYKETQNYVQTVQNNANGAPAVTNTDWRTRAQPVADATTQPTTPAPTAQPDWRTRATPVEGNDLGGFAAGVQGFNSAVPFGERIAAGLGAGGAYAYDKLSGLDSGTSLGDYYREARADQEQTAKKHGGAYLAGALTGIAATLPAASAKVIGGGEAATTGVRGAVNAIPEMLSSVGNFVRGGGVAADAGNLAKAANLAGVAGRSALVAAPAGATYAYGASKHDLDSPEALQDAESGAKLAAMLGAAVPVAGAALKGVLKPSVTDEAAELAQRAKQMGVDLSVDQVAPGAVRDTVQKISQNIPGSGVDAFRETQRGQWMRGVAKTIGQDSDNLGPETINKFLDDASDKFESIVKHTDIKFDTKSVDALQDIANEAKGNITGDYANIVKGKAEGIANQLFKVREVPSGLEYTPKPMTGSKLASIRSQLVKALPNVAGDAKQYVGKMVDVIDDIAEKNLAKEDIEKLGIARREWRNFKTLEPLLEKSTDGTINPTQLMQRVASSPYIKASRKVVGEDDLVDLARIGKQFLGTKGGSDTAQKLAYMQGAAKVTGYGASGIGAALLGPTKVAAAIAANKGYQMFNQSPAVVSAITRGAPTAASAIPIADMLAAGATQRITGQ